jgi:hypothetical protein
VQVNGKRATALSSFMITDEKKLTVRADQDTELLLVEVRMDV